METKTNDYSYVLSVKLYPGCYKHIQIDSSATFDALAHAILDAFSFDYDHLYAFFMSGKKWDHYGDVLAPSESEFDEALSDSDYCLSDYRLTKGIPFVLVYDFGAEWTFTISPLWTIPEATKDFKIIKEVGSNPSQYGDDDEDDCF